MTTETKSGKGDKKCLLHLGDDCPHCHGWIPEPGDALTAVESVDEAAFDYARGSGFFSTRRGLVMYGFKAGVNWAISNPEQIEKLRKERE